jgi:hypothetical protein
MPQPTVPRAASMALPLLVAGLLLPGAVAGQQPSPVPIPSLDGVRPESADRVRPQAVEDLRPASTSAPGPGQQPRLAVPPGPAPGSWLPAARDAVFALAGSPEDAPPDAREDLGGLGDVLPRELLRDLLELQARVQRYRTVLFGDRGIVRWGELEGAPEASRLRLNLQADPHPGLRVTLITR